jgi:hypothetical protein
MEIVLFSFKVLLSYEDLSAGAFRLELKKLVLSFSTYNSIYICLLTKQKM